MSPPADTSRLVALERPPIEAYEPPQDDPWGGFNDDPEVLAAEGRSAGAETEPHQEFWAARECLAHFRVFARARRASPFAVLGCALVRVVAHVEPFLVLPPNVGGDVSLNLFLGLVGPSGGGKGAAEAAAKDAIRFTTPLVEAGVGSGEGIAHTYQRSVPGEKGKKPVLEQHNTRALFRAPEVDTLGALKGRQGSTLLPQLRDAWMGDNLGFAYADVTRRLDLKQHSYRLCLIVGVQPERAAVLLDDADGGTPQRFLWMPTVDPFVPDQAPIAPPPMEWRCPPFGVTSGPRTHLRICGVASAAIDHAAVQRHRGAVEALDGHSLLARLKVAAALGLLDGRAEVREDDWQLAGTVMAVSDATRGAVVRTLTERKHVANLARGKAEGERAAVAEQIREESATQRVCRAVRNSLAKQQSGDWTSHSELRGRLASKDRPHFDGAVDRLLDAGQMEAETYEYKGQSGRRYRLPGGAI